MTDRRQFLATAAAAAFSLSLQDPAIQDPAPKPPPRYPKTLVVVRHAEKAAEPADDPGLTPVGDVRAAALASLFGKSGVTHLFASEFKRTQATLQPLATACGVSIATAKAADRRGLVASLEALPARAVAVVAGHSNTVPGLVAALTGATHRVEMAETDYDRVFVITRWDAGAAASVLELRF